MPFPDTGGPPEPTKANIKANEACNTEQMRLHSFKTIIAHRALEFAKVVASDMSIIEVEWSRDHEVRSVVRDNKRIQEFAESIAETLMEAFEPPDPDAAYHAEGDRFDEDRDKE